MSVIYDGSFNPQLNEQYVNNLIPGREYIFQIEAVNVNGPGVKSNFVSQISCIAPDFMPLPTIENIDRESVTLSWKPPQNLGGCPVTQFALYRDNGANSEINIQIDPPAFANKPDLFQYTANLGASLTGLTFHVKVIA